jgi:hypothetical protein
MLRKLVKLLLGSQERGHSVDVPAELLLKIRDEIDKSVERQVTASAEKINFKIRVIGISATVVIAALSWFGWDSIKNYLDSTEAGQQKKQIAGYSVEASNSSSVLSVYRDEISNRVVQLRNIDNFVRAKDFQAQTQKLDSVLARLEETQKKAELQLLLLRAKNDDALAYDELQSLSRKLDEIGQIARAALLEIDEEWWVNPRTDVGGFSSEPVPADIDEMKLRYQSFSRPIRAKAVHFIYNCPQYTRLEKLRFLAEVIAIDTSLWARRTAASLFKEETKVSFGIGDGGASAMWLKTNAAQFK